MAAPVHQSTVTDGNNTPSANTSRTVTKPSGLAVGDLMIAYGVTTNTSTTEFPSGFTLLGEVGFLGGTSFTAELAYKIADSSDVAASDFTFTSGVCSISRITGATAGGGIRYAEAKVDNSTTFSASGFTPADYGDGTLFMMFLSVSGGSSANIGSHAIATNNPSWTEVYDAGVGTNTVSIAHATRAEVTATGNFSASGAGSSSADWTGQMISIPVPYVFSTADTVTTTDVDKFDQTSKPTETVTLTDDNEADIPDWINEDKSGDLSITNEDKT